ncbi:hypothetical protein OY671_002238 [Metschnikowia pulcherrima]|nr:hypothetical protein OY671_002238 [Metschnikowia pulcherrima]
MAKKKQGRSQKKRSERKVLDAFHLAERAANGSESGSEGENDDLQVRDGIMDARKFMKNANGDGLEDEELDSDEAMASDDDYDVLNTKFSQTIRDKSKKRRRGEDSDSSSEDDEGYHSIDESKLVTLSEAWDMDERDLAQAKKSKDVVLDDAWDTASSDAGSASESESHSESESESESESGSESEDEEAMLRGSDDDADVDMAHTVQRVQQSLKPAHKHKRLITETVAENEFSVPTNGTKLSLAEMMAAGDPSAAPLVAQDDEDDNKALAVPLPRHMQERNNRKVAYDITKQDVSRWQESVRALQNADHVTFPLPPPAVEEQEEVDAEAEYDNLRFIPETAAPSELESKVNSLLQSGALLDESNEATFEQLASAKLSKEDLFKRTQELRRMRELMFRDEQRAKRIKKIKSKQFRKIRKRERLRDADLVEGSDAESDPEDHDRKRAEERMSLRHKTQSKWAQNMIKSGITKDASTRAELEEMLRAGERLRTKQLGHAEGEQSDGNVSDIEREYARDDAASDTEERGLLGKGVLAMDFMKAAEAKKRKENEKEMAFVKSMQGSGVEELAAEDNSINTFKNMGRRVYAPSVAAAKEEMEEIEEDTLRDVRDDDAKSLQNRLSAKDRRDDSEEPPAKRNKVTEEEFTGFDEQSDGESETEQPGKSGKSGKSDSGAGSESESDGANPWLTGGETVQKSKKFTTVTQDSSKLEKAANKIAKHTSKKGKPAKSTDTYIDLDKVMNISGNVMGSEDEDDNADTRMFRQQNLISEAFAGDDVVAEFRAEKEQVAAAEDDKEEDLTLPGWGGWGGVDEKKPKKKFVRKIDGVAQRDNRKDKGLDNVIVNETVNKHNLKYQSSSVPFPYESREQYERALRMPVGEEWASSATHQKTILPRVIVKQGVVIDPLKAPFK